MKRKYFLLIGLLLLITPVCAKAESKIYFQEEKMNVVPGGSYKVNIKVDSDSSFSGVNFDIITLSELVSFSKVKINKDFTNSSGTQYELLSDTPQKPGTTVATLLFKIDSDANIGDQLTLKITDGVLITNQSDELDDSSLELTVKKTNSNLLSNLSSKIAPIKFDKKTLRYEVNVDEDVDEFDLIATAEDPEAKVYMSSQKLNLRKNTIMIRVTREGLGEKTYKVIVHKKLTEDEKDKITDKSAQDEETRLLLKSKWLVVIVTLCVALILDLFFVKKRK